MTESFTYRFMEPGEQDAVCRLVQRVFNAFVAPLYPARGRRSFLAYVQPELLLARSLNDHAVLVALAPEGGEIVGALELRAYRHVSLLFVDGSYQGRGISRGLMHRALETCLQYRPSLEQVSVYASPNAVGVYERMGFHTAGPEQEHSGIRFTPMLLEVASWQGPGRAATPALQTKDVTP